MVLDSYALLVYLEKEPGFELVQKLLIDSSKGKINLFLSSINWGEIIYIVEREYGHKKSEEIIELLDTFPIEIVSIDTNFSRSAARFKAHNAMSFADCFAAALAEQKKCCVLTGDSEFKQVEKQIQIKWI